MVHRETFSLTAASCLLPSTGTPAKTSRDLCWREKIGVWLGLAVGICIPYFSLQRIATFPPLQVQVPETVFD